MPSRPILKDLSFLSPEAASNPLPFSSCSTILHSPHVHFPPTPTLASTVNTHSSSIYDRAPIEVTPNICALPERGGRMFIGSNDNQGGLGCFHPHTQFQVDAVRVERDSSTASPITFSASLTVGNISNSMGLFRKKRLGPMYEYDYDCEYDQYSSRDQYTPHARHVIPSFILDPPSDSDLNVFRSPPARYVPAPPSYPSSMPRSHSSSNLQNVYGTLTAPPSPSFTASNNTASAFTRRHKKTNSLDMSEKKKWKSREYNDKGECGTRGYSRELELEGCLGGF